MLSSKIIPSPVDSFQDASVNMCDSVFYPAETRCGNWVSEWVCETGNNLIIVTSLEWCHSMFVGWQVIAPVDMLTCQTDPGSASGLSKHRAPVLLDGSGES